MYFRGECFGEADHNYIVPCLAKARAYQAINDRGLYTQDFFFSFFIKITTFQSAYGGLSILRSHTRGGGQSGWFPHPSNKPLNDMFLPKISNLQNETYLALYTQTRVYSDMQWNAMGILFLHRLV